MARNRRDIDTGQKQAEIVAVARHLFLTDGYEATGMARIAAEAGVAPNTLYWYFTDKDALLIEILNALVAEALQAFGQVQGKPLDAQLLWLLDQFENTRTLVTTVHARLAVSPALATWHDGFHRMVEPVMVAQLATMKVPESERALAATIGMFVIEGLLSHPDAAAQRVAMTRLLASRLVPAS